MKPLLLSCTGKGLLLVLFSWLTVLSAHAQLSYSFSTSTTTYVYNPVGTTVVFGGNQTNQLSVPVQNIGFTFHYGCNDYTQFRLSSNGWLSLGNGTLSSMPTNDLSTINNGPILAPLWDNLTTASTGNVNFLVSGTAPNRILTVEWLDMEWNSTAAVISFQVKLYENGGQIDFVYKPEVRTTTTINGSASIGISGGLSATDFYSVKSIATPAVNTYGVQTSTLSALANSGQVYSWTPNNMAYSSCTTAQASTATISKCNNLSQVILGMQVVTSGCQTSATVTQFLINMTGSTITGSSTNDVTAIHIYYTGNSAGFAPANEFVSGGTVPAAGTITVNGSQALVSGTNYFWIAYDINASSATTGHVVAAQCTQMTVGANRTPAVNTSRSRTIAACSAAPGGITNMSFWVEANKGTSTTTDGGTLSTWSDQSGNGRTAAATATANRPAYKDNATDNINFNPVVNFSAAGNSFMPVASNGILSTGNNPYEVYAVLKPGAANLTSAGKFLFAGSGLNAYNAFDARSSNSYDDSWDVNDLIVGGLWTASYASLVSFDFNSSLRTIFVSGGSAGTKAGNLRWSTDNFNALGCQYNSSANTEYYDGGIAEIITYPNTAHDQGTRNKVESYLGLKYGVTLQHNYLSSNGTTVWNRNLNTSYNNNITGIGLDANGGLSQKQSKSTSVTADMLTMYIGSAKQVDQVQNTGSFSAGDGSFFVAGNNGASIVFAPGGTTDVPAGICCRLQRVWLSQSTNFTNTDLTLQFDFNVVTPGYGPLLVSDLRLLVDDNGVFSNATVLSSPTISISVASSVVTVVVPASSISSAKPYFTLASIANTTPLPLTVKDFSASCGNKEVQVKWTMGSTGNYNFIIERSSDGSSYSPVGSLTANPSTSQTYSWTDKFPLSGVNTYRLKAIDNSGDATLYSSVATVAGCVIGNTVVVASDAATHRSSMLILQLSQNAQVDIGFYDLTGHYLEMPGLTGQSNMGQGVYNLPIPQRNLATGIYLLSVSVNGIRSVYRIIQ